MSTTAAAAAGARSPPLPACRSPSPAAPPPPGAGPGGEPRALPEDAAAAAPSASRAGRAVSARRERARRHRELPLLPTFSGRSAPREEGGTQLPTKNNLERALGVSLPAHTRTRGGTPRATPHVPRPGPLPRGGQIRPHLGDARQEGRCDSRKGVRVGTCCASQTADLGAKGGSP